MEVFGVEELWKNGRTEAKICARVPYFRHIFTVRCIFFTHGVKTSTFYICQAYCSYKYISGTVLHVLDVGAKLTTSL